MQIGWPGPVRALAVSAVHGHLRPPFVAVRGSLFPSLADNMYVCPLLLVCISALHGILLSHVLSTAVPRRVRAHTHTETSNSRPPSFYLPTRAPFHFLDQA